jgi:butyryl-CoA dehydrogenase
MAYTYLQNSICIITGAGSGIGRELCLQGLSYGVEIIATDINRTTLEETHKLSGHNPNMKLFNFDISDSEQIDIFFNSVTTNIIGKRIILINNAGMGLLSGMFVDTSVEDIQWLFEINFWGLVRMTKKFLPLMTALNDGCIVNLSSVFGLGGFATQSAYCPTKFAVRGFTEVLRMELSNTDINTISVHPGGIDTNIARNSKVTDKIIAYREASINNFSVVARTSPKMAASSIWKAIIRKKKRLLIGPDAYLIDIIIRLFPVSYTKIVWYFFRNKFTIPEQTSK